MFILFSCTPHSPENICRDDTVILKEMKALLKNNLLDSWYPRIIDETNGGYHTRFNYKWELESSFPKPIVTLARGLWVASKAAQRYPHEKKFRTAAQHGFKFLNEKAWDSEYGGFYVTIPVKELPGPEHYKTAYGNAFAIYGLAAYYELTQSEKALELAQTAFHWLDEHFHDPVYGGYFQFASREGISYLDKVNFDRSIFPENYRPFCHCKEFNSTIHLLEAFSALYQQWPDSLLRERLSETLSILRDTMTTPTGYLKLMFTEDWQHISFKDSTRKFILENSYFDHVSFGHDVETAFLLLEAAHLLSQKCYEQTLPVAKRLIDHSLKTGFDEQFTGIFYEGYYFKYDSAITIINRRKQWWVQAEGLNALLMFTVLFPENPHYKNAFYHLWNFIKTYVIDHKRGGWYQEAISSNPRKNKRASKAGPWKSCYHNYRALSQCVELLETGSMPFLEPAR